MTWVKLDTSKLYLNRNRVRALLGGSQIAGVNVWGTGVFAFSAYCSQHRKDFYLRSVDEQFRAWCDTEECAFDVRTGQVVKGPARLPLDVFPVERRADGHWLDTGGSLWHRPRTLRFTMDNADIVEIRIEHGAVPAELVEFRLYLGPETSGWRKEIRLPGTLGRVVANGKNAIVGKTVQHAALMALPHKPIQLWKAKTFGVMVDVDALEPGRNLAPGARAHVIWHRD